MIALDAGPMALRAFGGPLGHDDCVARARAAMADPLAARQWARLAGVSAGRALMPVEACPFDPIAEVALAESWRELRRVSLDAAAIHVSRGGRLDPPVGARLPYADN